MEHGSTKKSARMVSLLTLVEQHGLIEIADLATRLDASPATVRRDVALLAEQGLLLRRHGAVQSLGHDSELPVQLRDARNRAAKRAIAAAVLAMLPQGRHAIALSGGTTTVEVMRALHHRHDLTIITNSLALALEAATQGQARVLVAGGVLRPNSQELVGSLAELTFNTVNVGTAIVGCDGITADAGLTTHDDVESRTNRAMIAAAQRVIAVADGSKLGKVMMAQIAGLADIDHLVTDPSAPASELQAIRAAGVSVTVVQPEPVAGGHPTRAVEEIPR